MKKLLLIFCASIMALSVSAQGFKMLPGKAKQLSAKTFKIGEYKIVNPEIPATLHDMAKIRANAKAVAKASVSSQSDLYGNYVEEDLYSDGSADYGTAILQEEQYNGATYVNMICLEELVDVIGTYNAETKKLTFDIQVCYEDETYGYILLYGITSISGSDIYVGNLTFTVGDDGVLKSDQMGIALVIYQGQYAGYMYNGYAGTLSLLRPNAVQTGTVQDAEDATAAPQAYNIPVRVEDNVTSVTVKGFCFYGALDINVNGDGTVTIPTKQNISYLYFEDEADTEKYGEYACFTGYSNGVIDYDKTSVPGTISGNVITITEPFNVCSLTPSGGVPISMGMFQAGTTITLDEGNYTSGIKDITISREEQLKNAKAYNIMGQRVDADNTKGLIIVNGKKYLKK